MKKEKQSQRKPFDVLLLAGGACLTLVALAWLAQTPPDTWYTGEGGDLIVLMGALLVVLGGISFIMRGYAGQHEARRLVATATLLLVFTSGVTGIGVFIVMKAQNRDILDEGVLDALNLSQTLFVSAIRDARSQLDSYAAEPLFAAGSTNARGNPMKRQIAGRSLMDMVANGATGVAVQTVQGNVVATAGKPLVHADMALPLARRDGTELVWAQNRFYLHSRHPITQAGRVLGYLRVDQALPRSLSHVLLDTPSLRTADVITALCGRNDTGIACFPNRLHPKPFRLPQQSGNADLPAARALSGEAGVATLKDYRGKTVVAAYAPLGDTGLGMVTGVHTEQMYGALAGKLLQLGPFLFVMLGLGIVLMRWRLKPLVSQLLESREEIRALIEHSPDAIVTIDQKGTVLLFSPSAERMFGWKAAEAAGRNVSMLMPEPDRSKHDGYLDKYLSTRRSHFINASPREILAVRKDGQPFAAEMSVAEFTAAGKRSFLGVVRDITARKATEEEYRLLFSTSLVGTALLSVEGAVLRANPAMARLLGYSADELMAIGLPTLLPPEDWAQFEGTMDRLLTGDTTAEAGETGLLRLLHKSGRRVWVKFALALAQDTIREARWLVLQTADVSAERQTLEALMRSERRFRAIFDEAASAIGVLDRDGRILEINAAAAKLLGYEIDELRAMKATAVLHPEDREETLALLSNVFADGRGAKHLLRLQQRNGSIRHANVSAALMRGDDNHPDTLVVMAQDITEMVRVRNALAEQKAFLNTVLESISAGVVACDKNGELVYFNQAAKSLHNVVEMHSPASDWSRTYDLYRADGRTRLGADEVPLYRALHGEEVSDAEIVIAPRGKPTRRALCTGRKMRSDAGDDLGAVIAIHDITALRESEAETRWLVEIIETTSDLVVTMDDDGHIAYINSAGRQLLGLTEEQVSEDLWLRDFYPDASADRMMKEGIPAALHAGTWQGECMVRDRSGREIPVSQVIVAHREQTEQRRRVSTIMRDLTERKRAQERVTWLAYHDPLTNLPNRFLLRDRVEQAITKAIRHERNLALIFLDIDRFKNINDTLGHEVGDQLLKDVAGRLGHIVRGDDTVARIGGDEFVILIEDFVDPADTSLVAQKVVDGLAAPFTLQGREFFVTGSAGVAIFPTDGEDVRTLLRNADTAMYRAKERGRNQFYFYQPEMNVHLAERLSLENNLRRALEREEFLLYYQPKVALSSGTITGMEALLRWNHPERGLVSPLDFIPLLEETGLIGPVSAWVLDTACLQLKTWHDMGFADLRMAINLSPRQFAQDGASETLARHVRQYGLKTGALEVEITESLLMQHAERAAQMLQEIRALGITIAIDDFGTGYSSLAYLTRFPVDTLKIDRAFVRGLPEDRNDAAIARAILEMARALEIRVIAEGVETASQAVFLRAHGCQEMQGWLFAKALPAQEVETMLQEGRTLAL